MTEQHVNWSEFINSNVEVVFNHGWHEGVIKKVDDTYITVERLPASNGDILASVLIPIALGIHKINLSNRGIKPEDVPRDLSMD